VVQPYAERISSEGETTMPKYRLMAERARYTEYYKEFTAATEEEAEALAEQEVDWSRVPLEELGWTEGDSTTEYELKTDATEPLDEEAAS
jgi:hypothetical protein